MLPRPATGPALAICALIAACGPAAPAAQVQSPPSATARTAGNANAADLPAIPLADAPFTLVQIADFDEPWAVAALPGGGFLVTEKSGRLVHLAPDGTRRDIAGTPTPVVRGQGGFGDVVLHPGFARNARVYLSWVEAGDNGTSGAVVGRATLDLAAVRPALSGLDIIWRQSPKVEGDGHFAHRIAFGPDGMLYIASGERQKFTPAQDMAVNLGKIVRLTDTGAVPPDNPRAANGGVGAQIWSAGHRNPLGIAFDGDGRLWEIEMGPQGGDELNLIERGGNYGWPNASNGSHYDGRDIPDHVPADGYVAPKIWWTPSLSPANLLIYAGTGFPAWRGDALVGGLSGTALDRIDLNGDTARAADRWALDLRVRALAQAPDGGLYLLEDGGRRGAGRLYRIEPKR